MANTIILKKSGVLGKAPLTSNLSLGEIAINYKDGYLFYRDNETSPAVHKVNAGDADTVDGFHHDQSLLTTASPSFAGLTVDTSTLYVDAVNNRVGIGRTNPSQELDVLGDIKASATVEASRVHIASDLRHQGDEDTKLNFDTDTINLITAGTTALTVNSSGNVGIGVTDPDSKLEVAGSVHVSASGTTRLDLDSNVKITGQYNVNGAEYTYLNMYNGSNASINIGTKHSLGYISFESGNGAYTERMRITNTGNVGIGTGSPTQRLEVYPDTDSSAIIGRAHIGYTQYGDLAGFSHLDVAGTIGSYALLQQNEGTTYLNAANGKSIYFRINNSTKATINASGLTLNTLSGATTDTDRFLVSDGGVVKYRTGAQLLSDIGALAAADADSLDYVGNTISEPVQIYNPWGVNKYYDGVATNRFHGRSELLSLSVDGGTASAPSGYLTDGGYEYSAGVYGTVGGSDVVLLYDFETNGLTGSNGFTYSSGQFHIHFYPGRHPTAITARVKDRNDNWTSMTMTGYREYTTGNYISWRGTCPIGNWITAVEFTLTPQGTGGSTISLTELEYHGTRMNLSEGGLLTKVGGDIFGDLSFNDSYKAKFGTGDDLQIYHDGSNSYIADGGTGSLYTETNAFRLVNAAGNENMISAYENGAVELYYNNSKKLETLTSGVKLTGSQSYIFGGDNEILAGQDTGGYYFASGNGQNLTKPVIIGDNNDYIKFNSGDAERMRITNTGYVGIGTTSPAAKLDVAGNTDTDVLLGRARFGSHVTDYMYISHYDFGTSSNYALKQSPAGGTALNAPTGQSVSLNINNSEKLVVNSAGNVGIGTTSPAVDLHVADDVRIDDQLYVRSISSQYFSSSNNLSLIYGDAANFTVSSNATERFRIDSSGNVGIGTTSPSSLLHLSSSGPAVLTIEADTDNATETDNAYIDFIQDGGNVGGKVGLEGTAGVTFTDSLQNGAFLGGDQGVQLYANGAAGLTLESGGDIGIGTNAPATRLDVYKSTSTSGSSTGTPLLRLHNYVGSDLSQQKTFVDFTLTDDNGNETPQVRIGAEVGQNGDANSQAKEGCGAFVVYTNNADTDSGDAGASLEERMRVDYQGNVGIGTTSPSAKLDVYGGHIRRSIDANNYAQLAASSSGGFIHGYGGGSEKFIIRAYANSGVQAFFTAGNVGIGTATPAARLELKASTADSSANAFVVKDSASASLFSVRNDGRVDATGNVVIGGDLTVNGTTTTIDTATLAVEDHNIELGNVTTPSNSTANNGGITLLGGTDGDKTITWVGSSQAWTLNQNVSVGGRLYITTVDSNTTSTSALVLNGTEVEKRTLGSNAFNSTAYLPLSGGSLTGALDFNSITGRAITITGDSGLDSADASIYLGNSTSSYGWDLKYIGSGSGNNNRFDIVSTNAGSPVTALSILQDGFVGINVTDPDSRLEVKSTGSSTANAFRVRNSGDHSLFSVRDDGIVQIDTNYLHVANTAGAYFNGAIRARNGITNDQGVLTITGDVNFDSNTLFVDSTDDRVGIGTTTPSYDLQVNGGVKAGGKVTYEKAYTSLDTTGQAVAAIGTSSNGASSLFEFTCFGGSGGYQKVVWSMWNVSGTWYSSKVIDEGTNTFDVTYSGGTFTFKARSSTQGYSPRVIVEAAGYSIDNSYA